jgi:hypothetical protein
MAPTRNFLRLPSFSFRPNVQAQQSQHAHRKQKPKNPKKKHANAEEDKIVRSNGPYSVVLFTHS